MGSFATPVETYAQPGQCKMVVTPSWSTPVAFENGYQSTLTLAIDLDGRADSRYTDGSINIPVQVSSQSSTPVLFSQLAPSTKFTVTNSTANVQTLTYSFPDNTFYESHFATGAIATYFATSRAALDAPTFQVTQGIQVVYHLDGVFGFCSLPDHIYSVGESGRRIFKVVQP